MENSFELDRLRRDLQDEVSNLRRELEDEAGNRRRSFQVCQAENGELWTAIRELREEVADLRVAAGLAGPQDGEHARKVNNV